MGDNDCRIVGKSSKIFKRRVVKFLRGEKKSIKISKSRVSKRKDVKSVREVYLKEET